MNDIADADDPGDRSNTTERIRWSPPGSSTWKTARVICGGPEDPPTDFAHGYAPIEPGTNLPMINALIKVIIDENLIDRNFIDTRRKTMNHETISGRLHARMGGGHSKYQQTPSGNLPVNMRRLTKP